MHKVVFDWAPDWSLGFKATLSWVSLPICPQTQCNNCSSYSSSSVTKFCILGLNPPMELLGLPRVISCTLLSYLLPKHIQWSSLRYRVPSPQKLPEVIPPLCSPHTWLVLPPQFPSKTSQQGTRDAKSSHLSAKQMLANHGHHVMTFLVVGPMQVTLSSYHGTKS